MGKMKHHSADEGMREHESHERVGGGGRFRRLKTQLAREGADDPAALAAAIGRKKYGKKRFQKMAAAGRRRAGK